LDDAVFARFGDSAKKIPFVFKGRSLGFANFSKFFLGRNGENQCVAGEKIWIRRFFDFAASRAAMDLRIEGCPKISLARFRIFRNKLLRPWSGSESGRTGGIHCGAALLGAGSAPERSDARRDNATIIQACKEP
jgi:hypothetical protein